MWISRDIEAEMKRRVEARSVALVTGPRQTGKTALLRHLFPEANYVTLDLPSEAQQAEKDPRSFLARHPPPVMIDEVQYAPGLFRHLKVEVDRNPRKKAQFMLTGSQRFALMKNVSESLAGRVDVMEIEGLSIRDIRGAHPKLSLEERVIRGCYPELFVDLNLSATNFYRSYVATYLERDLRALLNVNSLRDFEQFLRACALRSGQLLNLADLARDVGISPVTAKQWMGVLQASNLVILVEPWFINKSKSMTKSPKLYLADSGLLSYLLNIQSVEDLLKSPLLGSIWESYVFAELRKFQMLVEGAWAIHFWRDRSKEVDFVIQRGGRLELIEVKWTEHPNQRDLLAFEAVESAVDSKKIAKGTIICRASNPYPFSQKYGASSLEDFVLVRNR